MIYHISQSGGPRGCDKQKTCIMIEEFQIENSEPIHIVVLTSAFWILNCPKKYILKNKAEFAAEKEFLRCVHEEYCKGCGALADTCAEYFLEKIK